ncbi:MAG: glucosyltransferase domain-containing protein [Lachnospiraceae bacterium]|nr:glucosyltransferase domain-containing protein [Lachnospiraceae bacterium]
MNGELKINKKFCTAMISSIIWFMAAHGYRMCNLIYFHDTLLNAVRADIAYQESLGRFMQPFVILLLGSITSSWLISVTAILFLGLSVWLVCDIFDIEGNAGIFFVAGILICNNVLTVANYTFLPWLDVYAIALFFALLGVELIKKGTAWRNIAGCVCFIVSMGLYQAYISVGMAAAVIILLKELYEGTKSKEFLKKAWKYPVSFLASGVSYYMIYRIVLKVKGISESNAYNGLGGVTKFEFSAIPGLIGITYYNFFAFLSDIGVYASGKVHGIQINSILHKAIIVINIFVLAVVIVGIIRINIKKKNSFSQIALQCLLLVLFPMAANFVCFMSKGTEHGLMVYGILFLYILALLILKENVKLAERGKRKDLAFILLLPVAWLVLNNIVFSNQIYVKAHLQEENYQSIMTRIVYQIENTEGYKWGETPVAFLGIFGRSDYIPKDDYFDQIGTGVTPFTNNATYINYMKYHLGANINLTEMPVTEKIGEDMPCFPEPGYIRYIDDVLVVKISD